MAVVETTPVDEQEPEPRTVELKLWPDDCELLDELLGRTGLTASQLALHAFGALWRELEGIVLPAPGPPVDMEQLIRNAEEDIRAGRTIPHQEVMAEARKIIAGAEARDTEPQDDDYRRHFTPDQIAAIEAGLAAIERGDTVPHDQVVAKIKAKFGW